MINKFFVNEISVYKAIEIISKNFYYNTLIIFNINYYIILIINIY